ncbi:MAG: hypothetical protein ACI9DO_002415 [Reinekea sp.]
MHKNTVASWVKNGLPCLKDMRPFLILGAEAKAYLQNKRGQNKQKCKPNQLYCMRCKAPKMPLDNFVEYSPMTTTKGLLTGFCSHCDCVVNKFIGVKSLKDYSNIFDLKIPIAANNINDSNNPL